MSKYKNAIFGVILSVLSSLITIAGYHMVGGVSSQASYNIVGPVTANVGNLLEYGVQTENLSWWAHKPIWQWDVFEANSGETDFRQDGSGIFFVAAPNATQYYIVCSGVVYHNYFVWGYNEQLGVLVQTVPVNGSPTPTPTPNPNPNPTPTPPAPNPTIPDGKFKVSSLAYQLFTQVAYNDKPGLAKALGSNYTGVASAIKAGAITTLNDTFKIIQQKNQATLSSLNVSSSIVSDWMGGVKKNMEDNYSSKQMAKLNDFADFFSEVALGLSYVK